MFFTPFIGYVYDIVGRFWFLVPSIFFLAIQLALLPYTSPNFFLLVALRALMGCFMRIIFINPLILDYVKSESRGLGMGLATYGFVFGELLMISIFELTRPMTMK